MGDGAGTGADYGQEAVVVEFGGEGGQVAVVLHGGIEGFQAVAVLLEEFLQYDNGLLGGVEMQGALQGGAQAAEVLHPAAESGFVLGFGRDCHHYLAQGVVLIGTMRRDRSTSQERLLRRLTAKLPRIGLSASLLRPMRRLVISCSLTVWMMPEAMLRS